MRMFGEDDDSAPGAAAKQNDARAASAPVTAAASTKKGVGKEGKGKGKSKGAGKRRARRKGKGKGKGKEVEQKVEKEVEKEILDEEDGGKTFSLSSAPSSPSPSTITVHRLDFGNPFELLCERTDTLDTLRAKIEQATDVPVPSQLLCVGSSVYGQNRHIGRMISAHCVGSASCSSLIPSPGKTTQHLLLFDSRAPHAFFHCLSEFEMDKPPPLATNDSALSDKIVPVSSGLVPLPCTPDYTIGMVKATYETLTEVKQENVLVLSGPKEQYNDNDWLGEEYFMQSPNEAKAEWIVLGTQAGTVRVFSVVCTLAPYT